MGSTVEALRPAVRRACFAAAALACSSGWAAASDRHAVLVTDQTTGATLVSRAADERRYPASLTKMMTLYVLFADLERGRLALDSPLPVSARAAAQPPTKLGLRSGQVVRVEDAIKALVTRSANDAAVVVAEALEGSEAAFADRMTQTARTLGMNQTRFRNASGLPDPEQYTTARDMSILGAALQAHHPQYFGYFSTQAFRFRGRTIRTHNRLVERVDGVDGIKTGYIRASGFNVVTSVRRDGRALVAVVMGGRTARQRDRQMEELIAASLPRAKVSAGAVQDMQASQSASAVP